MAETVSPGATHTVFKKKLYHLSPSHIPYKTSLRPEKDQKSVPITRPTCERRTLVLQVFEVL